MSANGYLQLVFYVVVLLALAKPLGTYMARIYAGEPALLNRIGAPFERLIYRLCGIDPAEEMRWTQYAMAALWFSLLGTLAVYALQRLQFSLPLNPQALAAVTPDSAFNTAASFATNTNWQGYGGESSMSYLTQMLALCVSAEQAGNPSLAKLGVDQTASATQAGGNMEGKEARFGIVNSALWATATTAASNGSVNSMHDSFTPIGAMVPMWLMQLGEVIFGGVGSGLYGMIVFAIVTVFVAGLMIGRTPEYLGKKIEAFEIKMAAIVVLVPLAVVLGGTALAVMLEAGKAGVANPGAHGYSEILYAFSSAGNNNGSAFAGLSANTPFYNTALGIAMFFSRFWLMLPTLALAGALAAKKKVPVGLGTLPTHTPLFVFFLIGVVLIVGALTFIPALALGPVIEHLVLYGIK